MTGLLSLAALAILPFGADACDDDATALVCSSSGTETVIFLPSAALVGAVISVIAVTRSAGARAVGILIGSVVALAGLLIAWALLRGPDLAEPRDTRNAA